MDRRQAFGQELMEYVQERTWRTKWATELDEINPAWNLMYLSLHMVSAVLENCVYAATKTGQCSLPGF